MDFDRKERAQSVASLLELLLAFEGLSRRASRAASDPRLTDGEIRLLINLLEKPSCQTELARALATDTGQINRTIGGLRRKLLVRAQPNSPRPKDEHLLVLTDLGGVWATSARIQQYDETKKPLNQYRPQNIARLLALAISAAELRFDGAPGLFVREAMPGDIGLLMQIAAEMIPWKFGRSLERVGQYVAQTFLDYQAARTGSFNIFIGEYWGEVAGGIITAADPDSGGALISLLVVKRIYAGQRGREHAREKQCRVVAQRRI